MGEVVWGGRVQGGQGCCGVGWDKSGITKLKGVNIFLKNSGGPLGEYFFV